MFSEEYIGFTIPHCKTNYIMTATDLYPLFNYRPYPQITISFVAMNSVVFELHMVKVAAMLRGREMWNANSSLVEFCLCSLSLIRCLFSLLTQQLALCSGSERGGGRERESLCIILISFHTLGKALLALRYLSSFQTHRQWPL